MQKKAQAAMEFLMTYGWALLVVIAAIGALAYFGVLKPQQFLPEQCILPTSSAMTCLDFKVTPDEIVLLLSNSLKDKEIIEIAAGNCSQSFNYDFLEGTEATLTLSGCSNGESGDKFKEEIKITYVAGGSGFIKTTKGSLAAKIQ